jgi:hypothetical protein
MAEPYPLRSAGMEIAAGKPLPQANMPVSDENIEDHKVHKENLALC